MKKRVLLSAFLMAACQPDDVDQSIGRSSGGDRVFGVSFGDNGTVYAVSDSRLFFTATALRRRKRNVGRGPPTHPKRLHEPLMRIWRSSQPRNSCA